MDTGKIDVKPLGWAVLFVVATECAGLLISRYGAPKMPVLAALRMVQIIGLTGLILPKGKGLAPIGLDPSDLQNGIKSGVKWSAGFGGAAILVLAGLIVSESSFLDHLGTIPYSRPDELAGFMILACVIGPAAEEIFFRGYLFGFFRKWGVWPAMGLSTTLFAMAHLPARVSLVQIIGGLALAAVYETSQSLYAPIMVHILGNTAIYTLMIFVPRFLS